MDPACNSTFGVVTERKISAMALSPDGEQVLTGNLQGDINLWKSGGEPIPTLSMKHPSLGTYTPVIEYVNFSPDGIFLISRDDGFGTEVWRQNGSSFSSQLSSRGEIIFSGLDFGENNDEAIVAFSLVELDGDYKEDHFIQLWSSTPSLLFAQMLETSCSWLKLYIVNSPGDKEICPE